MKGVQERLEFGKQSPGLFQEVPWLDETRVHPHRLGLHAPCWLPSGLAPHPLPLAQAMCICLRSPGPCLAGGRRTAGLLWAGSRCPHGQEGWEEVLPTHVPHSWVLSHLTLRPSSLPPFLCSPKAQLLSHRDIRADGSSGNWPWQPPPPRTSCPEQRRMLP